MRKRPSGTYDLGASAAHTDEGLQARECDEARSFEFIKLHHFGHPISSSEGEHISTTA
jgi:hypothetical protein